VNPDSGCSVTTGAMPPRPDEDEPLEDKAVIVLALVSVTVTSVVHDSQTVDSVRELGLALIKLVEEVLVKWNSEVAKESIGSKATLIKVVNFILFVMWVSQVISNWPSQGGQTWFI